MIKKQNFQRGQIRPHTSKLSLLVRLVDAGFIVGIVWALCWAYQVPWNAKFFNSAVVTIAIYWPVAEFTNLYRSWRGIPFARMFFLVLMVWGGVLLLLLFLAYGFKVSADYSRRVMLTWFAVTPFLLFLWRYAIYSALAWARASGYNSRSVAVFGIGAEGMQLVRFLANSPDMGLHLKGVYDDMHPKKTATDMQAFAQTEGDFDALLEKAKNAEIDAVYITLPLHAGKRIREIVSALADTTVSVYIVPDLAISELLHSRWSYIGNTPAVSVTETPFYGVDGTLKRLEDMLLGSLILLLSALPMLAISIAVKLTSPGPVIFKQQRYGLNGKQIAVWKFRSMTVCENGGVIPQATKNDSRLTPIGGFLRRTSLDELPQFINVLQGSMSIVGPRPHAVAHNEQYRKLIHGYMLRHKVKPGITGWAQANGWRGETDTLEKMQKRIDCDLEYIRYWSLWLDIKIIFLTIIKSFSNKNAY